MTTLLKNGKVVNVFIDRIEEADVLIEDGRIIGVGDYDTADTVVDLEGRYVCPGFIDGHIHIESTMLLPRELAKVCVPHGTAAITADPHEIANVCGVDGIRFFMDASRGIPLRCYFMLPSCVPATRFDESGAELSAADIDGLYALPQVLGLAEMMNYPGVVMGDPGVLEKIRKAREKGKVINGHAPLLSGHDLDRYIAQGVQDDHECSDFNEALEKLRKGQWIMIREGTSARNLEALLPLFDEPYNRRAILATDDRHPYDLLTEGHIDHVIREAVRLGKSPLTAIRMATIQAAQCLGIPWTGAVAPGYTADLLVLDDLEKVDIRDVYHEGRPVYQNKELLPFEEEDPAAQEKNDRIFRSVHLKTQKAEDFAIAPEGDTCRVIGAIPGSLLTREIIRRVDLPHGNGVDTARDIIKIAVCERHAATGHIGLGLIEGLGILHGAIASTVSHDSHNLIIAGANEEDMALAGNRAAELGGGLVVVKDGKVLAEMALPVGGIVSEKSAAEVAAENRLVREAAKELGTREGIEPFMNLAFISLSVIPSLKITTGGLIDVDRQTPVSLFTDEKLEEETV